MIPLLAQATLEEALEWQRMDMAYAAEKQGQFFIIFLIVGLLLHVYFAISFTKIASKTGTANGWLAWIPLANIALMLMIAKRPMWWVILLLIPIVNVVIMIITMMDIAKNRGKPAWMGILVIVPIVNLVLPGYLAFSK